MDTPISRECRTSSDSRRPDDDKRTERAGLHRNYIGGVERGERNIGLLNVDRLAAALNSPLPDLFSDL